MTPKLLLAAIAALAIAIGFALPGPHDHAPKGHSQIPTLEVGQG